MSEHDDTPVTPDMIPMVGARMVRICEPEEGGQWQEGLIKELTGGEPISVRAVTGNFIGVEVAFKLRISGRDTRGFRGLSQ